MSSDEEDLNRMGVSLGFRLPQIPRPPRLFDMGRIRKGPIWQFVKLSARPDVTKDDESLDNSDAEFAYCLKCSCSIPFQIGKHKVKEHMEKFHMKELMHAEAKAAASNKDQLAVEPAARQLSTELVTEANERLARWIASSGRPLSLVDDLMFRDYIQFITKSLGGVDLPVPKRTEMKSLITRIAAKERVLLGEEIVQEVDHFCFTTDVWTDMPSRSYISFTLHCLTPAFDLKNHTLEVIQFPGKHTGVAISNALSVIMDEWKLPKQRCVKMLRDGASNAVAAGNKLAVNHMSCVAHCFHLIVAGALTKTPGSKSGAALLAAANSTEEFAAAHDELMCEELDTVREIVKKFRAFAVYVKKSPKASKRLELLQQSLGHKKLSVKPDCPTRWNSCRDMLRRMRRIRPSVNAFIKYARSPNQQEFDEFKLEPFTEEEWLIVRCLLILLEPFQYATKWLGKSSFPTLTMVHPILRSMRRVLLEDTLEKVFVDNMHLERIETIIVLMKSVRRCIVKLFDKRFDLDDKSLVWVSALDPRFRAMLFVTEDDAEDAKRTLLRKLLEVVDGDVIEEGDDSEDDFDEAAMPTPKKMKMRMDSFMLGESESTQRRAPVRTVRHECEDEINKYLGEKQIGTEDNPIAWWASNHQRFPRLARLASKWLCVQATTVPSERAFSTSQNIVNAKRCSLTSETVRDLVFLAEMHKSRLRRDGVVVDKNDESDDSENEVDT